MKILIALLSLSLSAFASSTSYEGKISSEILGKRTLNVTLEVPYGAKGRAESSVSIDYDTRDMHCDQSLKINVGSISYSVGQLKSSETLTLTLGSSAPIDSEDQCSLTAVYSARDMQNQWISSGSHSSLVLGVKKSGNNTITTRLTFQFTLPFAIVDGDLVRLHNGDDYQLSDINARLNNSTYIFYQIVEETRGDYTSWSTLEQGHIDLNNK